MNWPPAALVAGVFVIGLAVGFVLAFGLWPGGRPTERLPPTVAVVAAHLLIGVGLIWYAAEPARWLRTVLVVLVVPGTFAVLLSVAVIGFKHEASWAAGDDEQGLAKERERGAATLTLFGREFQNPSRPFGWLLAAAISWLALGFAVAPPGSYRPPDLAAQTPSWLSWTNWLAIIEDLYQAGATLVILVGAAWLTAEANRRRKWADATGGLGCLSVIAIFIFIMFLIGGWALVGQFRIMRE